MRYLTKESHKSRLYRKLELIRGRPWQDIDEYLGMVLEFLSDHDQWKSTIKDTAQDPFLNAKVVLSIKLVEIIIFAKNEACIPLKNLHKRGLTAALKNMESLVQSLVDAGDIYE